MCIVPYWESPYPRLLDYKVPAQNEVCRIRDIVAHFSDVFLILHNYPDEVFFCHTGFRPLEERKTDISVFTALLKDTRIKEDA